jgi:hypothetical protein
VKKLLKVSLMLLCFGIYLKANSQNTDSLPNRENVISAYLDKLAANRVDSEKLVINAELLDYFAKTLALPEAFEYPFGKLKKMANLISKDKKVRILNWNLPMGDGSQQYFGFMMYDHKKSKTIKIIPLVDNSDKIENPENAILTANNWFGVLYYQLVDIKLKGATQYILMGWDGNNDFTAKKLIEVLSFDNLGNARFGAPVWLTKEGRKKRVIFEYSKKSQMSLRYEEATDEIIFDRLVPSSPLYKGQYQYYGPDGGYDGFYFEKGKWVYKESIDARNQPTKRKKVLQVSDKLLK